MTQCTEAAKKTHLALAAEEIRRSVVAMNRRWNLFDVRALAMLSVLSTAYAHEAHSKPDRQSGAIDLEDLFQHRVRFSEEEEPGALPNEVRSRATTISLSYQVDPRRSFPWERLASAGFGLWCHEQPLPPLPDSFDSLLALQDIGYDVADPAGALAAFRRHFLGIDAEGEASDAERRLMQCLVIEKRPKPVS